MANAKFRIDRVGPLVSFQDLGRNGHMRYGVPKSGPMDVFSFKKANALLGNDPNNTGIEISIGGLEIECLKGVASAVVCGGDFNLMIDGEELKRDEVFNFAAGQRLNIRADKSGSWCYLAFAGNIITKTWLGSSATHLISGSGGGTLKVDQSFCVENTVNVEPNTHVRSNLAETYNGYIRVTMGPQDHQTTGGYPKIATVISSDLDMLAQLRPNQTLRFKAVSPESAVRIARVKMIEQT